MAERVRRMNTTGVTVDPVCGMTVATEGRIRVEHDGRAFVFCSTNCRDRFLADPDRYVSPSTTPSIHGADLGPGGGSTAPSERGLRGGPPPGLEAMDRVKLGMTARTTTRDAAAVGCR